MTPPWGEKGEALCQPLRLLRLFDFPATLLPVPFARQRLFDAQFFARLQVEGVPLDFFNDVFLLHLTLEASEGVLQGFTLLESDFSQSENTSQPTTDSPAAIRLGTDIIWAWF
jgi:hypothetical protein